MNPAVLFIITTDPRRSPRAEEAVRIAAGVSAWKKIAVTLYLCGAAVLALSEYPDELADGDHFRRYLPMVAESGGLVCAECSAPLLSEIGEPLVPFRRINADELAALTSENDYVIRF